MTCFRILLTAFLFQFSIYPFLYGFVQAKTTSGQERTKLDDVTRQIELKKEELRNVEHQESQVISRLNEMEMQLQRENAEQEKINKRIEAIQRKIQESSVNFRAYQAEVNGREGYLRSRLGALYKYSRRSGLKILLSANTCNDFLRQEKYLGAIIQRDNMLLKDSLAVFNKSKRYQEDLNSNHQELIRAKDDLIQKNIAIRQTHEEKVAFLNQIRAEKTLQLNALKDLEEYSRQLQEVVDRLPQEKRVFVPSAKTFSSMCGRLLHPVKGRIITSFGKKEHPELHTFTFQKGIEIEASMGSEIKAIFDGKVVYADWFKGYGYTIIIDHGESYYSLSAHASALLKKNDDIVTAGETIALVGDTNSMKGSCLYFEIRHHGKPQNPLTWLKKGT